MTKEKIKTMSKNGVDKIKIAAMTAPAVLAATIVPAFAEEITEKITQLAGNLIGQLRTIATPIVILSVIAYLVVWLTPIAGDDTRKKVKKSAIGVMIAYALIFFVPSIITTIANTVAPNDLAGIESQINNAVQPIA